MAKRTRLTRLDEELENMIAQEIERLRQELNMKKVTKSDALRSLLYKKEKTKKKLLSLQRKLMLMPFILVMVFSLRILNS